MPSILFYDSWDHYDTSQLTTKWQSQIGLYAPYQPPQITTEAGRRGYGLKTHTGGLLYKSFTDTATVAVGFSFRPVTLSSRRIAALRDESTIQLYLHLSSTGKVQVFRGNGTLLGTSNDSLLPNKFYYIELGATISSASGTVTLRINGKTTRGFATISSANTQVSSFNRVNILSLGDPTSNTAVFHYDDVWITDGEMLGPMSIDVLRPNGGVPGYMNMQTVGAGSHYQALDDTTPDGNTTYVYSAASWVGSVHFSEFENIREATGGAIRGVAVHTYARKEYGNTRGFKTGMYPGTYDGAPGNIRYYADPLYVETEYAYHSDYYATNPGTGGTWTVGSINALRAGFSRYI